MRVLARSLLAAAALALALPALGAESVRVRAGLHDGFARLVFDWTTPVKFDVKVEGQRLVVSFARPFEADYAEVLRHLDGYVGAAAPGADGRSVSFPLLRSIDVRAALIDGVVAVDLRNGPPASAAKAAETVGLRTGAHDGYSRLVFDWRRDVPYKVDTKDGRAVVTFSRAAAIDAAAIERARPQHVEGFEARIEAGKTIVELSLAAGARVRHFRDGPRIALDVLAPSKQAEAAKPQAQPAKEQPVPAPKAEAAKPQAQAAP